jgi:hypothetical protein
MKRIRINTDRPTNDHKHWITAYHAWDDEGGVYETYHCDQRHYQACWAVLRERPIQAAWGRLSSKRIVTRLDLKPDLDLPEYLGDLPF